MNCPKCNNELVEFDTTVYVMNKRTKKMEPVIEPWLICRKTITDLGIEGVINPCRFVVKKEDFHGV